MLFWFQAILSPEKELPVGGVAVSHGSYRLRFCGFPCASSQYTGREVKPVP